MGKITAIVLAAGQGKRMNSGVQKQFMLLDGKPLLYYSLKVFEESRVDDIILVTSFGEITYCKEEIVSRFGFSKVRQVIEGGKERYHSVYQGLKAATDSEFVLIHDGARPMVTEEIIEAAINGAMEHSACVIGMPVKDTIKIADEYGYAAQTPSRSSLWLIQTPQAFNYSVVRGAYDRLMSDEQNQRNITDDAMVVETMTEYRVKLVTGAYENLKITTPEDMEVAEVFLKRKVR